MRGEHDYYSHEVLDELAFDYFASAVSTEAVRRLLQQDRLAQGLGFVGVTYESSASLEDSNIQQIGWAITTKDGKLSFRLGKEVRALPLERAEEILASIDARAQLADESC